MTPFAGLTTPQIDPTGTLFRDPARGLTILEQGAAVLSRDLDVPIEMFEQLLLKELPRHYSEVDRSFTASLLVTSSADRDPNGYFTRAKQTFWLLEDDKPVGFTVTSLKRGGSVKIGPTAIVASRRRQGLATLLRDVVEGFLEHELKCRKLYMTIATSNVPALLFNLARGFKVEAVLREQYRSGADEVVLGRFRGDYAGTMLTAPLSCEPSAAPVTISRLIEPSPADVETLLHPRMNGLYDQIDPSYYEAIADACCNLRQSYALKGKQLFIAQRAGTIVGVAVYVPKRGGASKLSPLFVEDAESTRALLEFIEAYAMEFGRRKLYAHVPLPHLNTVRWLLERGYLMEGLLREPYREGIDLVVMGQQLW